MSRMIDNLATVLLFALGVGGTFVLLRCPLWLNFALDCGVVLGAVLFIVTAICGRRARGELLQSLFAIGVVWAGFVWTVWLLAPNRGYMLALWCGVFLAPAYILVAVRRRYGIGMRAFVGTALVILILLGTRVWPWRHLGLELYVALPLFAALLAKIFIPQGERPIPPGFCQSCEYDLTGNVSGVCPECGTDVKKQ